jgi:hypothetical protein
MPSEVRADRRAAIDVSRTNKHKWGPPMHFYRRRALLSCLSAFAFAALATGAQAQVTAEQQSALKANCRSDFMAKCSGISPGGQEALACLQKNVGTLSPSCKQAVSATLPPPAPAAAKPAAAAPAATAAAPTAAQQSAMKQACRSDFMAKCSGVSPGGQAALACLQKNVGTLSPSCKQAVSATMAGAPAATPAAAPAAAAAAPTAAQQNALKQACRSDFMAKCSGVTPGGQAALACLQKNASTLSAGCQQAVAAIGGGAATAATVTAAPAAGPTPEQLKAVKFTCRGDFKRYCGGVQPGGQEAIMCLQTNAARLTPDCKTSLADIADSMPAGTTPPAATAAAPAAAAATPHRLPAITPAGRILRRVIEHNR